MQDQAERLATGIGRLERSEVAIRQDITHTQELLVRGVADIELEMQALHVELKHLEHEMEATVERAKRIVGQYKVVVKRGDLARLEGRIELWAPEKRVTRQQFYKMLQSL